MTTRRYFYLTAGRHIARLDQTKTGYRNAEILYDNHWQKAFPADLLWNMQPINKATALDLLVKWNPQLITKSTLLDNFRTFEWPRASDLKELVTESRV